MSGVWLLGLIRARPWPLASAAAGVALAVALLAILGLFVSHSAETMTARAIANVAPDWQVQLVGTTEAEMAAAAVAEASPGAKTATVDYADAKSFAATTGDTVQTTGAGEVVGLDPSYRVAFPRQLRLLSGSFDGALLAQQTAANLHVGPGNSVTIERLGQPPVTIKIGGIVDMPSADQFFQVVGASTQAAPTAPPDNVVFLPREQWRGLFETQLENMPQTAERQLHVSIDHASLSPDPVSALIDATALANNLSARLAGEGVIANNLAARLDGVRADALFAKMLFLFLGVPGAVVAIILTAFIVMAGIDRCRRDIALLQVRGATSLEALLLTGLEALLVGLSGAALGVMLAWVVASGLMGLPAGLWAGWYGFAAIAGVIASLTVFAGPAFAALARTGIQNAAQVQALDTKAPAWKRLWLDIAMLAIAGAVFWQSAATGYQVVAAPEGVATATVDYKAYIAPALLWIGCALLLARLWSAFLRHGRNILRTLVQPLARAFSGPVSSVLNRERNRITKGVVLVALAFSFAASTAVFNTTYERQAGIDATLTNGADVTVTGTLNSPASPKLSILRQLSGAAWAEPMQHRFAYVGNDLQDLYGIDPATIGNATAMSNAYFANGDVAATLAQLQATRDGVLVSDETVTDFQLKPGDKINLRLQSGKDFAYHAVPFTFIGVVREFPTAPSDSFLVANASYVAAMTGMASAETVLIKSNAAPADLAAKVRAALFAASGLKVSDIGEAVHRIGSSLVAVDLHSLTGLELVFALPIVAGALGLVFALGVVERRRSFAILSALGAQRRHLGAFLWSEALIVYVVGTIVGLALGTALAWVLVKLMTQVFDPPPETLAVPWLYLGLLAFVGFVSMSASVLLQLRRPAQPLSFSLRNI